MFYSIVVVLDALVLVVINKGILKARVKLVFFLLLLDETCGILSTDIRKR